MNRNLPGFFGDAAVSPFWRMLQRDMDRFWAPAGTEQGGEQGFAVMPAIDVAEKDGAIEITAELPGVKEDELDVSLTDGVLTLKGEKSSDSERKEKDYHVVERRYGSFRRQIPLGFMPETDKVSAAFNDGVLTLTIQRPAETEEKTRKIPISRG
jgi:HSP20 family protein